MQKLRSQRANEKNEELNEEIRKDWRKANAFPNSIIGRKRLRKLRILLCKINILMPIMYNSAQITNDYCIKLKKENHIINRIISGW